MTLKNYTPLALIAADEEDIEVVSSLLQDAVVKVGDMTYLPAARRFAFVANRFVWEEGQQKRFGPFTRVRVGVHVDDVRAVRTKAVRMDAKGAVVNILNIDFTRAQEGAGLFTFTLAGGGAIALEVEAINMSVRDISEPWRTQNKPNHEIE
ncbi:MAG: DUF2948 family protein [Pseudomonadota bacterium]